ncbi:MAG TPA: replication initiation protein, partial [Variovorax sp.]|nr:replication initiation protein [Variovorax sp.]
MVEEDNSQSRSPPRQPPTAEEQSVAKANEAIAIRPKRGRLTLLSRRIYNALLYHSQRQGVDEPVYRLTLSELIGDARFNSNNTELLKSHLRDMQATTIEWSTSSSSLKRWVSSQLLGTVTIEEQGRGRPCMVTWRYPDEIKERLVKPHQYTRVLLEMSSQMRSYSAAVLYEIGARYLTSPGRLSMREDVVWWAAVLTGRSDIKEVDYRFLKRDVISKALAEIDALCEDFGLELIEHKRGRKIEEIQFRVVPKVQQRLGDISASDRNVFDLALVGRLIALGLKQDEAQDLYATTDEGQIRATLDHVDQRLRNASMPGLKSPAAYFKDALKKGYAGVTAVEPAPSSGP